MDDIISKINEELTAGESPNSLLLKTIKNEEPMCFFLTEYLLSKGADCYAEALYEASKHNNINIINLMLPRTTDIQHILAYLSACLEGNNVTRTVMYKNINMNTNKTCHYVYMCLGDVLVVQGAQSYQKVLNITEEIIEYGNTDQTPGRQRGIIYRCITQGAIRSNNIEAIKLMLPNVPSAYYNELINFAQTNKKVSQNTIDYLINNKHNMRSCSVCIVS